MIRLLFIILTFSTLVLGACDDTNCHCMPSKSQWCTNDTHGDQVCIPTSFSTWTPTIHR